MLVLIDLVAGKLAAENLRENIIGVIGGHGRLRDQLVFNVTAIA
jgi:hypothetical protein